MSLYLVYALLYHKKTLRIWEPWHIKTKKTLESGTSPGRWKTSNSGDQVHQGGHGARPPIHEWRVCQVAQQRPRSTVEVMCHGQPFLISIFLSFFLIFLFSSNFFHLPMFYPINFLMFVNWKCLIFHWMKRNGKWTGFQHVHMFSLYWYSCFRKKVHHQDQHWMYVLYRMPFLVSIFELSSLHFEWKLPLCVLEVINIKTNKQTDSFEACMDKILHIKKSHCHLNPCNIYWIKH